MPSPRRSVPAAHGARRADLVLTAQPCCSREHYRGGEIV